ncbi:hypothetical protein AAC387_Pa02g5086 [Persea americana]
MISSVTTHTYIGPRHSIFRPPKPLLYKGLLRSHNSLLRKPLRSSPSSPMEPTAAPALVLTSGASGRVNALLSLRSLRVAAALLHWLFLLISPFQRRKPPSDGISKEKENKRRSPAAEVWPGDLEVAARRAMAIRRVGQGSDSRMSLRESSLLATSRGDTLFTQSWTPASVKFRGLVILLHGLNEHSGRYDDFAKQLNVNGYKVYGMDWIGHGGSDGLHGYVHSLDDAVSDIKAFIEKVLAENSGYPCFLFGHSTGAAILLKAVLDPKIETLVDGIILTSPAIRVQPSHPIFLVLAPIFSFLFPKYQFGAANKQGLPVSRNPDALVAKYSDPLVYTGSIRVRTGYEILRISSYLQKSINRISVPFLVMHGTADTITDPEASQMLYKDASCTDKSIKLYEGFLHDLLIEPEREEIVKDILDWLNCKLAFMID